VRDYVADYLRQVESVAIGIPVYLISVLIHSGLDIFDQYLLPGKTIVFLGSSGVGKSTIINYLIRGD
jgi:ribosome biogenesis GTPase / thiamine phosphate phosphatase